MDSSGAIFLTGSSGFLGMELLARCLEQTDRTVYALMRGRDEANAAERLRSAARAVVPDADRYDHRLVAVKGDALRPRLGLHPKDFDRIATEVGEIVHSAASVSFTLPLDEAREINVEGTRRVLELAERSLARGGLARVSHVSTAYVAGTHRGVFHEPDLERGQDFNNTYERTKWEAERLVRARMGSLPITIFRPSIVVGEEDSGWTPAFNVMYGPLRAYSRGSLTVVPARRSAPVDVVPASYVADAICDLAARPDSVGHTYTLAAGELASTVGELIDMSADAFGRRRGLALPPWLYRRAVHPLLLRRAKGSRRRTLQRAEVFFPYFDVRARFDTSAASEALGRAGIRVPPLRSYFETLVQFARAAEWGRRPLTRVEARAALGPQPPDRSPRRQPVPA